LNRRKQILTGLCAICGAVWIVAAIHPLDRPAWILENILLLVVVTAILFLHRRLHLSNVSYFCVAAFIILHIVGAHYTYSQMPLGLWAKAYFALPRNHYDRLAHAAFGFLLAFPLRELLLRFSGTTRTWSFWLALAPILAVSGLFEILESIVAEIMAPGKGVEWLGGQGDEWDAQNDMLAATIGAIMMMSLVAITERKVRNG
jgi:putative membrane protein